MKNITISDVELLKLLKIAYEEGWYGSKDLGEVVARKLIEGIKTPQYAPSARTIDQYVKEANEIHNRSDLLQRNLFDVHWAVSQEQIQQQIQQEPEQTQEGVSEQPQDGITSSQHNLMINPMQNYGLGIELQEQAGLQDQSLSEQNMDDEL